MTDMEKKENNEVQVKQTGTIEIEECPIEHTFTIRSCKDAKVYTIDEVELESLGRIATINLVIKNVCPNKRLAAAIVLTETTNPYHEFPRGTKVFTIPAHNQPTCIDMHVNNIKFALPENVEECDNYTSICRDRNFTVKTFVHYIDTDYACDEAE